MTGGAFTRADWEATPDDGRRYELLDGAIIVTPAPGKPHQRMALRLGLLLDDAAPDSVEVFPLPIKPGAVDRGHPRA
ncbi:MAG TPA: hypothetical protein PLZ93_05900 [Nocardioides sp.]|nr:hypothetical protein [Nocardioides sp.]HRK44950.1 hypothetical protein [Nocardioides sp.]